MYGRSLALAVLALLCCGVEASAQQDAQAWLERCRDRAQDSERAVYCEVRPSTLQLGAAGLAVDASPNGGVVVRGGPVRAAEISARIQVQAATDDAARGLAQRVRVETGGGRVRSEGPTTGNGESWSVTYYITVPQRTNLELGTVNGPVSVHDVSGRLQVETRNGPLQLERLAGDVHARTRNGPLTVVLSGARWDGVGLDAATTNGPVRLIVPEGYGAELEVGTERGPFDAQFAMPVTLTGRFRGRFTTTLGEGGPPVRVLTTNGPFRIARP
jgi:hypothetical protein